MCGGGGDTPDAPDYSGLIAAATKGSDQAMKWMTENMDFFKKAYADNKQVSDIVTDKALGQMDKMIGDSDRARERYQSFFEPLEEALARDAESYASPERIQQEAGRAEADVAQQFEQAREVASQNLEQYGVDPSQTRQGALDLGTRMAEAAAQVSAGNQARTQTENIGRALRSEAINLGRNIAGGVNTSGAAGGQAGTAAVNTGLATTASGAQTMGTPMAWNQAGNQGLTAAANFQNAQFGNEMDAFKAEQESSSGWGDILGMGLKIGGKAFGIPGFAAGGAIPDDGALLPDEMSPSGGAIPDDIPAEIDGQAPAQLNAGEFIVPQDVVKWVGEKGMQQFILKSRKEMEGGNGERPAQPEMGPPPMPVDGVGAIPPPPQGV
jgi:hypothetical protein